MKILCSILMASFVTSLSAQPAGPDVSADGRVRFRLRAPDAHSVSVQYEGQKKSQAMEKGDDGVWTFQTPPLEPDFYGYSFFVDGVRALDLSNPLMKYNLLGSESMVHVPGPASLPWELNDVPHGVLHHHFFKSAVCDDNRDFYVYTPPGYDPASRRQYPVFYLLHGYSDDASAWSAVGRQNIILDNLIARGQARPMVVVMPLGYGTTAILRHGWSRASSPGMWDTNITLFRRSLLEEVLPQVEKSYRVSKNRQDRAIAGLSMGGGESLLVGLNDLDQFAWVGAFSSGGLANFDKYFPTASTTDNDRLKLLWLSCGKSDGLFGVNSEFVQWLGRKGVRCSWNEVPGVHSWMVWRRNLAAFASKIFQ